MYESILFHSNSFPIPPKENLEFGFRIDGLVWAYPSGYALFEDEFKDPGFRTLVGLPDPFNDLEGRANQTNDRLLTTKNMKSSLRHYKPGWDSRDNTICDEIIRLCQGEQCCCPTAIRLILFLRRYIKGEGSCSILTVPLLPCPPTKRTSTRCYTLLADQPYQRLMESIYNLDLDPTLGYKTLHTTV